MNRNLKTAMLAGLVATTALVSPVFAQDVQLMEGIEPRAGDNSTVEAGAFQSDAPWTIGMSHFGVNANTWTVQMSHESTAAAALDSRIENFILLDANIDQAKQVADIEDLIAQGVDAIIVTPLTPTSADAGIEKAVAAGIPVIVHTGLTETDAFTLEIQGGAQNFGRVMGQFLVDDNGKKVCETFYLSNPNVDGIWSSGADMTRACVDVFKEFGAEIPPTTGEGNNGFFGQWVEDGFASISAEYGPEQGAAGVRAAIALLEGQEMYKHYAYEPEGWDLEQVTEAYRPDLSANVWFPTSLTEERLQELYGQ